MPLQLTLIDTHEKLTAFKPEWDELAGDNPFLSWDWADTWWRHYETPQMKLFTLAVRDEANQLVGLAPWKLRQTLTRGRVVRFIGSNEVCGDRLTILTRPDRRANVLQAIAEWLATDAGNAWDLLELTGVEESNHSIAEFATMMTDRGHQTHFREDLNCWKIPLAKTWEEYLANLSRGRRNKTRRLLKRTLDTGKACQRSVISPADFQLGYGVLVDLHQKRRNMLGEPGCFASDRYHAFHQEFAQRLLARGKLRLVWVEFEGQPAAVEYSMLGEGTIYNYQSGFDPAFADEHPGWLNLVTTLRWAIAAGYHTFDMLRGDESYKASFGAQAEPLRQVRIVGSQSSAKLRHAAWRTQITMKRWAREGLKLANDLRRGSSQPAVETPEPEPAAND
jgi:CelD/BcsL family acetyltransferase involved in cellulose biosynthesis